MKQNKLNLKENEELMVDVDDLMEQELKTFRNFVEGIEDYTKFSVWVNVYKMLNYDIIEDLKVEEVFKFNDTAAVIKLSFRGKTEYDFLSLNPDSLTVGCMNVKEDKVRPYCVRRLLVPETVEEALMYAKSTLPAEGIKTVQTTLNLIKKDGDKYSVKKQSESKEQPKQQPQQNKSKEQPKQESKQTKTQEQPKQKEQPKQYVPQQPKKDNRPQPNYKCAVGRVERIKPEPKKPRPQVGWQADGSYKFY